jgi:hypothetical protein
MTKSEIKASAEANEYFNLDKLDEIDPPHKTKFASEAAEKDAGSNPVTSAVEKPYDVYERYGAFWAIVDRDEDGNPIPKTEKIGLDNDGKPLEGAEWLEVIVTVLQSENKRLLIGFKIRGAIPTDQLSVVFAMCILQKTVV